MISSKTELLLKQLMAEQDSYTPTATVSRQIAGKTLICFVGASCMGKSTIMEGLLALNSKYGVFRTIASRDPRPDDKPGRYTYYPHTDEGLQPLLAKIQNHELLQYAVIPGSLSLRGSEASGYPYQYNLGDILSNAMPTYRKLGFGRLDVLSVVCEPATWHSRFDSRFPAGHPDRTARLQEAIASLQWSLAQTDDDHHWIINAEGKLETAVQTSNDAILLRHYPDQAAAQTMARQCSSLAQELLQ